MIRSRLLRASLLIGALVLLASACAAEDDDSAIADAAARAQAQAEAAGADAAAANTEATAARAEAAASGAEAAAATAAAEAADAAAEAAAAVATEAIAAANLAQATAEGNQEAVAAAEAALSDAQEAAAAAQAEAAAAQAEAAAAQADAAAAQAEAAAAQAEAEQARAAAEEAAAEAEAAAAQPPPPPPEEPEVFVMAVAAVPSNADPAVTEGKPSTELNPMFAGTLVQYVTPDPGATTWPSPADVEPYVAESVTPISDGYRFVLRDDAVSPYGNTITSEDVRWSFDRIIANDGVGRFLLSWGGGIDLEGPIRVIDDRTFDLVVLDTNNPYSLAVLTYHHMVPLDSVEVLSHATDDDPWGAGWLATNSASFGSYMLESITPGEELRLVPNPNWWGAAPDIDLIVVRAIPDAAGRLQLLQAGEVDFADKLTLAQFASLSGDLQAIAAKGNTTVPLVLNSSFEPFADVRVRQAISSAIDRDALVQGPMQGSAKAALYQVLSEVPQPPPPGDPATYDPDRARALLAEAGYGDGLAFTMTINPVRPGPFSEDIAVLMKAQLAEVGVDMSIEVMASSADFQTKLQEGALQAWLSSQTPGISDPQFAWLLVHHSAKAFENAHGYNNPRIDELIDLMAFTQYGPDRDAMVLEAHQILIDEVPWVPLIELVNPISLGPGVESFRMDIFRRIIPEELAKN
ncbi:MAG: ABC transporter substrate-binding protein [bacterium]|nr:ABC transporter substrate-binding protein [bacterium]